MNRCSSIAALSALWAVGCDPSPSSMDDTLETARLTVVPSVDFGAAPAGRRQTRSVSIRNEGPSPLTVAARVTGSPAFMVEGPRVDIPALSDVAVEVSFVPLLPAGAVQTGWLELSCEGAECGANVELRGRALLEGEIAVLPTNLFFDRVVEGSTATRTLSVTNVGESASTVRILGPNSDAFTATSTGFELGPGQQQLVPVAFHPPAALRYESMLMVEGNDDVIEVSLRGEGREAEGCRLSVSPSQLNLGTIPRDRVVRRAFEFRNIGLLEACTLSSRLVRNDLSAPQSVFLPEGHLDGVTILPGESRALALEFRPTCNSECHNCGSRLEVFYLDGTTVVTLDLAGLPLSERIDPLVIVPNEVSFEPTSVGCERRSAVRLFNTGSDPLRLADIEVDAPFRTSPDHSMPPRIPADHELELEVVFAPQEDKPYSSSILISSWREVCGVSQLVTRGVAVGGTGLPSGEPCN